MAILVNPAGSVVEVPDEQQAAALQQGYASASPAQTVDFARRDADAKKYGTVPQELATAAEGAGSALTFGASDWLERGLGVDAEGMAARERTNPIAHGVGTGVGLIAPALLTGGAAAAAEGVEGVSALARVGRLLPANALTRLGEAATEGLAGEGASTAARIGARAAGTALEGAGYGTGSVVHRAALGEEQTPESVFEELGMGALFGGALGGTGAALGEAAGPGFDAVKKAVGPKLSSWLVDEEARSVIKQSGEIQGGIRKLREKYGRDGMVQLARDGRDLGLVSPLSTPAQTYQRSIALMKSAGADIGEIVNQADARLTPDTAPRIEDLVAKARAEILRPLVDDVFQTRAAKTLGEDLDALQAKYAGDLTLSDLHKIRQNIDTAVYGLSESANPSRTVLMSSLRDLRGIVSDELAAGIDRAGAGTDAWKAANRRYQVASQFESFASKGENRQWGNNRIPLTMVLGALIGSSAGGPLGAIAVGTGSYLLKKYGAGLTGEAARVLREALEKGVTTTGVDLGAETEPEAVAAVLGASRPPPTGSSSTKVVTPQVPGGDPARFTLREADDLVSSHDPQTFAPDPRYPAGVQERDYLRSPEEQRKVMVGGQRLNPAFVLTDSPTAVDGPPIVTGGELPLVLGGNGRTMMLRRAYDAGTAGTYRAALEQKAPLFGLQPSDVAALKKPVLVRELEQLDAAAGPDKLAGAVRRFNESMTQGLSPKARAVSEARLLSPGSVEAIGELMAAAPADSSLRDLMREKPRELVEILKRDGLVTAQNRSSMVAGNELTDEAKDRLEGMFLGRVLGTGERFTATAPGLLKKIERAVPSLIRVQGINPAFDEVASVQGAVDLLNDAARRNVSLNDLLKQGDLLGGGPTRDTAAVRMAQILDGPAGAVAPRLRGWAQVAAFDPRQATMFAPNPSRGQARAALFAGLPDAPGAPPMPRAGVAPTDVPSALVVRAGAESQKPLEAALGDPVEVGEHVAQLGMGGLLGDEAPSMGGLLDEVAKSAPKVTEAMRAVQDEKAAALGVGPYATADDVEAAARAKTDEATRALNEHLLKLGGRNVSDPRSLLQAIRKATPRGTLSRQVRDTLLDFVHDQVVASGLADEAGGRSLATRLLEGKEPDKLPITFSEAVDLMEDLHAVPLGARAAQAVGSELSRVLTGEPAQAWKDFADARDEAASLSAAADSMRMGARPGPARHDVLGELHGGPLEAAAAGAVRDVSDSHGKAASDTLATALKAHLPGFSPKDETPFSAGHADALGVARDAVPPLASPGTVGDVTTPGARTTAATVAVKSAVDDARAKLDSAAEAAVSGKVPDNLKAQKPAKPEEVAQSMRRVRQLVSDPTRLARAIDAHTQALATHAPAVAQAARTTMTRALMYLAASLPPSRAPSLTSGVAGEPSRPDMVAWQRRLEAVQHPAVALANGGSKEALDTVSAVYPSVGAAASTSLLRSLTKDGRTPTYQQVMRVSRLTGMPLTRAQMLPLPPPVPAPQPGPKQPRPSLVGERRLQTADRMRTPLERVESGERRR